MITQTRRARSTHSRISVIDNRNLDFETSDPSLRWYTFCEDHGKCVGHQTKALVISWAAEPEMWCPTCQAQVSSDTPPV